MCGIVDTEKPVGSTAATVRPVSYTHLDVYKRQGKGRVAVVADEGREDVVAHEEGREQQEDAGVVQAQRHDCLLYTSRCV